MVTRKQIADGFRSLGVREGDVILAHSSLSSFGRVRGGADAVIDGILDALGEAGTLLVPTLTGDESLSPDRPPHIDLRTHPCWTGRIPETLRLREGACRSIHPTHSCAALGGRKEELTMDHYLSPTPCNLTSPYFRVAQAKGCIALIGCSLETCTTFHTVEELANLEYVCQSDVTQATCIDPYGNKIDTPLRLHSYQGPKRDFSVMDLVLQRKGLMRVGHIGNCTIRLIHSTGLIETAMDKLRHDPYYLTALRTWNG